MPDGEGFRMYTMHDQVDLDIFRGNHECLCPGRVDGRCFSVLLFAIAILVAVATDLLTQADVARSILAGDRESPHPCRRRPGRCSSATFACHEAGLEFFNRYFDDRGYLECVDRWGGDDGPDDAIDAWPIGRCCTALGGSTRVFDVFKKGWEGHLRQYTAAKTVDVEMARDGMYFKEFPVLFDWLHHAEGLTAFINSGLADPHDPAFQRRIRRFAGLYLGEDPGVAELRSAAQDHPQPVQWQPRSAAVQSHGPGLGRRPDRGRGALPPGHGERSYARDGRALQGLQRHRRRSSAKSVRDESGDRIAFMLEHEPKYRDWVLEYVNAWVERMQANGGIIPTNIGLDGSIGGDMWRPLVWRRLWLGLHGHYAANRCAGESQHAPSRIERIRQCDAALRATQKYADAWRRKSPRSMHKSKTENGHDCVPANVWRPGVVRVQPL